MNDLTTILLWIAGGAVAVIVIFVVVLFFGFSDWMNRGSH
jgi:hypothetical protein